MRHSQGHNSQQQYSKKKKRLSGKRRKAKKSFLFFTMFENGPKSLIFLKRSVFKYFLSNRLFLDENGSSQTGNKSAVITQPLQLFDCFSCFFWFLKVCRVSCGGDHTLVLTESGDVYSFGTSSNGQLGLGTRILESAEPLKIASISGHHTVVGISCGENHTALVTQDGKLLTFGDGRHGKLCLDVETLTNHYTPVPSSRFRVRWPLSTPTLPSFHSVGKNSPNVSFLIHSVLYTSVMHPIFHRFWNGISDFLHWHVILLLGSFKEPRTRIQNQTLHQKPARKEK